MRHQGVALFLCSPTLHPTPVTVVACRTCCQMERKSSGKTKDPDDLPDYTNAVDMTPGALGGGGGFGGFGGDEAPPLYDEVVRL